jgi:signal transduction histidine kinase
MNALPLSDVSLYELAVQTNPPPHLLQLSPTTFKSVVGLVFEFLVEQNSSATVWLKLPQGDVWQAEVDRFCQLMTAPCSIYSLQSHQKPNSIASISAAQMPTQTGNVPDGREEPSHRSASSAEMQEFGFDDLTLDDSPEAPPLPGNAKVHYLPLAANSQLKREYFLLVVSSAFHGLVLTHRPRSVRTLQDGARLSQLAEESLERRHPLLGICSFEPVVLQRVLEEGINPAICFGQPDSASPTLENLLLSWNDLKQQNLATSLDPGGLGKLLTKQIQQQENLWRSSAIQRRQSETLPLLQQENEALLEALQAKNEFIKTIGLELRTPLSTMKTALSLLNSPNIKPPQRQRYMEMLSQECDRQSSLITGVLDLIQLESTVDEPRLEALRLAEVVPGVVSTYQPLAQEKGVMLGYIVPEDLPAVACLAPWLKQIVINLLHNSIKFTPKGGQVWVRAKQQGDSVQLEFRDTGIGIASNDLPRIFERFYRVRGSEDSAGVGLGLSIVQQLLLRCGGSVSVKSKQGEGSVFCVLLPIYQAG